MTERTANSWRSWLALSLIVALCVVVLLPGGSPPYLRDVALRVRLRNWVTGRIVAHQTEGAEFIVEGMDPWKLDVDYRVLVRFDEGPPEETPELAAVIYHDNLVDNCVTLVFSSGESRTLDRKSFEFHQSTEDAELCSPMKAYLYLLREKSADTTASP